MTNVSPIIKTVWESQVNVDNIQNIHIDSNIDSNLVFWFKNILIWGKAKGSIVYDSSSSSKKRQIHFDFG